MQQLQMPQAIFDRMLAQAKQAVPLEACGILAGRLPSGDEGGGCVEKFYEMTNADKSAVHFTMVPEEQFKVARDIRACGLEMMAVYHSHPATPARFSQEDMRLAVTPGVMYMILSLAEASAPVLKAFSVEDGAANEVQIKIVKG